MQKLWRWSDKHRVLHEQDGQALVMFALGMVVLIGMLALAVDVGQMRYARRQLQTQADAAALAAALELQACNGSRNCAAMQAAAQSSLAENGNASIELVLACASTGTTANAATSLSLNNPPCALAEQDSNAGNVSVVEVVLSRNQATHFAGVLGLTSMRIAARAEASIAPATANSGSQSSRAAELVQ